MGELINKPDQKQFRQKLRRQATPAENMLWKLLKNKQVGGLKFRRQHGVGPFILDFYCPEIRLAIELDGEPHNKQEEYDDIRSEYLYREAKITVLRFENRMAFINPSSIIDGILEFKEKNRGSVD
ncbi:endonuclease domain-containing protein [Bacteroides sp. 224]|uniref:endonuclease domain-containing protein n=1 Tax=Bacteroides sp. 224 TaxID=2302936 RepID=UPI0013D65BA0|nr:DUF559 domain-containing protein [Bacteroides sp. 224]NDV65465.1 DUF559 domain-containing protein [Bacteroides sp. 224]